MTPSSASPCQLNKYLHLNSTSLNADPSLSTDSEMEHEGTGRYLLMLQIVPCDERENETLEISGGGGCGMMETFLLV